MLSATTTPASDSSAQLPAGCELIEIEFSRGPVDGQTIWLDLMDSGKNQFLLLKRVPIRELPKTGVADNQLQIVTVPLIPGDNQTGGHHELVCRLQAECETGHTTERRDRGGYVKSALLTLQGTQILWRPSQLVVFAPPERLESICHAIAQASFYEHELRQLEHDLDQAWEHVAVDSPFAFEFTERAVARRQELSTRFQLAITLRTRYARLIPQVIVPHVYPPTLASQIAERLRERTRMAERLELLVEKLESLERIYELCSQRVSEFMVARTGHHLEWAIIIILLAQTALLVIEYMASVSG